MNIGRMPMPHALEDSMTGQLLLAWIVRFLHIASAIALIGAPFYVRFALMPAAKENLDEPTNLKLRDAIGKRWRHVVYMLITILIVTGLYSFLVQTHLPPEFGQTEGKLITARWKEFSPEDKKVYHMLFGVKMLAAFGTFFLASALAGRTKTFAPIRLKADVYVTFLLLLGMLALICATLLRFLPLHPGIPAPTPSP
jgi:uncharacterized membrane protein